MDVGGGGCAEAWVRKVGSGPWLGLVVALVLGGCGGGTPSGGDAGGGPDAAGGDAARVADGTVDGGRGDGAAGDGGLAMDAGRDALADGSGGGDGAPMDGAVADGAARDGAPADGAPADGAPADPCEGVDPGLPRDRSRWASYSEREYTPLEPGASHANVSVRRGAYKAAATVPLAPGDFGHIVFEDTAYYDIAQKMVSLSVCPGDFGGRRGTALPAACVRTSNATGIMVFYYRTPSASQAFGCTLEPGRSYYLNVVHATDPEDLAGSNTCSASVCGFNVDTIEGPR